MYQLSEKFLILPPIRLYFTIVARTSTIALTPSKDVISEISYGGETSTTSIATTPSLATPLRIANASLGKKPPDSGQPVPGANPQSIESISKER